MIGDWDQNPATQETTEPRRLSRREAVARLTGLGLTVPTAATLAAQSALAGSPIATPAATPTGLVHKGINYDTGTSWAPDSGYLSREAWTDEVIARTSMRREIGIIRDELHCTSIAINGSVVERLVDGAAMALERELHVWLQPRVMGATTDETLDVLSEVARSAERLRKDSPHVGLNVGVEASLFTAGIIPGNSFEERVASLVSAGTQIRAFNRNLSAYLERATAAARASFGGDVTYSAGPWEWGGVDWGRFDVVGLDYYMDASNEATYVDDLRAFRRHGKPIVVTEFGCCCYEGAERAGGNGYDIVDWDKPVPELKGEYVRSERVQADYIAKLLGIFEAEAIHGAFVWTFIEDSPYSPDPRYDLDMASFGIVKVLPAGGYPPPPDGDYTYTVGPDDWEPKLAFGELARLYGST